MCQFDFRSWYDQFSIDKVRQYFGVRSRRATYFLRNLPMGAKFSCEVGQGTTWYLLAFDRHPSVKVFSIIDNVCFVGPRAHVRRAALEFVARCARAGAQINDQEISVEQRMTRQGVFCGEAYNIAESTRALGPKTVGKVTAARQMAEAMLAGAQHSTRQAAAVLSTAMYGAEVLRVDVARTITGDYARLMATTPGFTRRDWDGPARFPVRWREVVHLLEQVEANVPVAVCTMAEELNDDDNGEQQLTIVTDASAWGWAAAAFRQGQIVQTAAEPWSEKERGMMTSSVFAEPAASLKGALRFVTAADRSVVLVTDHLPLVAAAAASCAWRIRCEQYANCIGRLRALFPGTRFEWRFTTGLTNPVDGMSRGNAPLDDIRVPESKRRAELYQSNGRRQRKPWMV
jgi:hypothetical protein